MLSIRGNRDKTLAAKNLSANSSAVTGSGRGSLMWWQQLTQRQRIKELVDQLYVLDPQLTALSSVTNSSAPLLFTGDGVDGNGADNRHAQYPHTSTVKPSYYRSGCF